VAECVESMQTRDNIPVTVKTRIGIDDSDSYEFLQRFVHVVSEQSNCKVFIIHARKAWLKGLSPKQNRDIPPLDYPRVYLLKKEFPHLHISINGGIKSLDDIEEHLGHVDGVMIGREAYKNPFFLVNADQRIFKQHAAKTKRLEVLAEMKDYLDFELKKGIAPRYITRHMMGLFHGQPGAGEWRKKFARGEL